jgi:hypothetical protein
MLGAAASYNDNTLPLSNLLSPENHDSSSILDMMKAAGYAFVRTVKAAGRKQVLSAAMAMGAVLGAPHAAKAQNTFPSSGDVGIGTSSPTYNLDVQGQSFFNYSSYPVIVVQRSTSATTGQLTTGTFVTSTTGAAANGLGPIVGYQIQTSDGVYHCLWNTGAVMDGSSNTGDLIFNSYDPTNGCNEEYERMRILNNGNVGIGTATPSQMLSVAGGSVSISNNVNLGLQLANTSANGTNWWFISDTSGNFQYWNATKGTWPFFINGSNGYVGVAGILGPSYPLQVNGAVGASAYVTLSDARLKKDITPIAYGLTAVMKLHPVGFNWKNQDQEEKKHHQIGLIAQEVETVVPEVVTTADDPMQTKSVAYSSLVPVLIQALQEEQREITGLKQTVAKLKKTSSTISASRPSQLTGAKVAKVHAMP